MRVVLVALAGLVAPGFAQGLMRQRLPQWVAFGAMAIALALVAVTVWAVVLVAVIWVGTLFDAGLRYRRLRGTIAWSWFDPLASFGAAIVLQLVLRVFVVQAFKAPSVSMMPTVEVGDHFMINKLTGAPARGDIIVFRHPCQPGADYFKRVIAVGGDTVEIRCTTLYVNGTAVPRELVDDQCTYTEADERGGEHAITCSRYRETLDGHAFDTFQEREVPGIPDSRDFPLEAARACGGDQPAATIVDTAPEEAGPCKPHRHVVVPDGSVFVLGDNRPNSNDSRYWGVVPVDHVRGRAVGIWYPVSRFGAVR